eukprot:CAMPEP_0202492208 /NCGR_PEP_ID=MMETSP1361-20130828/9016_1 /ASSEMBLY_ACC=CAM_ASM_000849 /TAXON_ID=210615 /ORGANISM="Staurosira complex sp., Strain CCMP2646" /LENGTH=600 /DNA_ID=CAMNT_0049122387 /DNA_START=20 /DNA_END=1822 /DNA_ORIENTATION=-
MRILVSALMLALVGADISLPCHETEETLVEIQGNVSNFESVKIYNNTNHENFENDDSNLFKSFQESESGGVWQGCLPKDACFMAEIGGKVDDELTFKQDGMPVETRFTFPDLNARTFKTFVELGDCIPTCDEETESLLEFDIYIGYSGTSPVWWIQDEDSNRVAECDEIDGRCVFQTQGTRFHRVRQCLPSSQCHVFVAGDEQYSIYSNGPAFHVSSFNLTYNGELLARRQGFRFESVEFGNGCSPVPCHNDNEALFELFLIRDNSRGYYTLPELSLEVMDGLDIILQDSPGLDEALHYYRGCLSRLSCLNLTLSVPETDSVTLKNDSNYTVGYFEDGKVRVVFDNAIYRDSGYHFQSRGNVDLDTFSDATSFGNCSVPGFCSAGEMLLDVTLFAPGGENEYNYFGASVEYIDQQVDKPTPLYFSTIYDGYMPGQVYQTTQCIPSSGCADFVADYYDTWSMAFDYGISVNWQEKVERRFVDLGHYRASIHTALGGETCTQALTAEVVFTMAIISLVISVTVGYLIYRVLKPTNSAPLDGLEDGETCCSSDSDDESNQEMAMGIPKDELSDGSSSHTEVANGTDEDECINQTGVVILEDTL